MTRKLSRISLTKLASEESDVAGALVGHDKYKGTGSALKNSVNIVRNIKFRTRNAALQKKGIFVIIFRLGTRQQNGQSQKNGDFLSQLKKPSILIHLCKKIMKRITQIFHFDKVLLDSKITKIYILLSIIRYGCSGDLKGKAYD